MADQATDVSSNFVPVCAIGASAGGVVALRELFRHLPESLGLAYVVIIHLAPDQPSLLSEILASATDMPVEQIENSPKLRANRVYVIPPDRELIIEGDNIASRPFTEPRGHRAPIDRFFRSVAEGRGDGMAVILSGAGSDGAVGVKAVKERGGIIFVQDPSDAEYPIMPRSALASGVADFVAPIPRLAQRIVEVSRAKGEILSLSNDASDILLKRIISFLRAQLGHDFAAYKRATVLRRVARRMQVVRGASLEDYANYLFSNPEEAQELFGDLLISVTSFFRDSSAYDLLLEEVVAKLFEDPSEDGLRIWVAGCATGEEAYSIAILLIEEASRRQVHVPIQVFATDLDEGALGTAREGRYPLSIEGDVSEERLRRFFAREGTHYRIRKEVRDAVLFATHSVLKDPPFMRLDLISCRNLLIYLERDLQRKVCGLFAYGLKPNGYLFLGSAETIDAFPQTFSTVNRDARIYQLRSQAKRQLPVLGPFPRPPLAPSTQPVRSRKEDEERILGAIHLHALEHGAPPSAIVDSALIVMHLSATAGRFLMHGAGPPSSNVIDLVPTELKLDLRTALRRALERRESTLTPTILATIEGQRTRIALHVAPIIEKPDTPPSQALVLFLDGGPAAEMPSEDSGVGVDKLRNLREELSHVESRLDTAQREHETAIQDLRVANEELHSVNEEYRSTAEELETSKEELQSMNEELRTVNAELKSKLESIGAAHSDLENLVAATDVGTLFLDHQMRIRLFTPRVAEIFNVTEGDIGRAITDFTHRLSYNDISKEAARVLQDLIPSEHEIETLDGKFLILRLRPYRTIDDHISGVVVTFIDVSERRETLRAMRESEARFRALVSATSDVVYWMDPDWRGITTLQSRGSLPDQIKPHVSWLDAYILPEDRDEIAPRVAEAIESRTPVEIEHRVRRSNNDVGWTQSRAVPIEDERGRVIEWFGAATDITERRRDIEDLRSARDALALATAASKLGWGTWDFATRTASWDARGREIIGLREDESTVDDWLERVHPQDRLRIEAEVEACVAEQRSFGLEFRVRGPDGATRIVHGTGMFERDTKDRPAHGTGLVRDVTEARHLEEHQRLLIGELNHRVKNMLAVVQSIAGQTRRSSVDVETFFESFSIRIEALAKAHEILTRTAWIGADLRELVEGMLATMSDGVTAEADVTGPPLRLSPNAAVSFSLALYELGTNAIKYGAWSTSEGRVAIEWRVAGEKSFFQWIETGGPAPTPPARAGFGSRLLEKGVPWEMRGEARIAYEPEGLRYTLEFPIPRSDGE